MIIATLAKDIILKELFYSKDIIMNPLGVIYTAGDTLFVVKDFSDLIQRHIATKGLWEPELIKLLKYISTQITKNIGKCHLVNVGAHIGSVCVPSAKHFSRITAFEPVKSNFDHLNLHKNLNSVNHMITHNLALSDSICDSKIVFNPHNTGGCHVVSDYEVANSIRHAQNHIKDTVQCVSMDSIEFEDSIEILLVDIEGHEERFIKGAEQTIKTYKPVIIIELWTDEKRQHENMKTTQYEMIQKITSFGYNIVKQSGIDTFIFLNPSHFHCT